MDHLFFLDWINWSGERGERGEGGGGWDISLSQVRHHLNHLGVECSLELCQRIIGRKKQSFLHVYAQAQVVVVFVKADFTLAANHVQSTHLVMFLLPPDASQISFYVRKKLHFESQIWNNWGYMSLIWRMKILQNVQWKFQPDGKFPMHETSFSENDLEKFSFPQASKLQ